MDDNDDVVMESPREDFPSLDNIIVSAKTCMLSRNVDIFAMWDSVVV